MLRVWLAAAAAAALCAAARAQAARPSCPPAQAPRCAPAYVDGQLYTFNINSRYVTYDLTEVGIFALQCPPTVALDEPALPRFQPALRVRAVRLSGCWPRAGSYATALRALNLTALDAPTPGGAAAPPMYLVQLHLREVKNFDVNVLAAVATLRNLSIYYTHVAAADLALLPAGLERLELYSTRTGHVEAATLARLPRLDKLEVYDTEPVVVEVEGAQNLSSLMAISPKSWVSLSLPDTLRVLQLSGWALPRPDPWRSCARLERLLLFNVAAEALPDGWLARCQRVRELLVDNGPKLKTIAVDALRGARALRDVRLKRCALQSLPAGLLDDAPALRVLYLPDNRLHTLPGKLFSHSRSLNALDIMRNNLTGSALDALQSATSLGVLRLDGNGALDACPARAARPAAPADPAAAAVDGSSPLRSLKSLSVLTLAGTGTQRVCADWRRLPRLQWLDVSDTGVTRLDYDDIQFNTTVKKIEVIASNKHFVLRREDYESEAAARSGPAVSLGLREPLRCDCELYWAAAALRLPGSRLQDAEKARCAGGRALADVPLDELVCGVLDACPTGCACGVREDAARPGRVLRLDCAGAALRRVPRVDARAALLHSGPEPVAFDLRLAGNIIDRLDPQDLPAELSELDLRNNSLSLIGTEMAAALVSRAGRVWLAGNPLECSCRAAAALAALRARPDVFRDWADATCADGTPLAEAEPGPCDDGSTSEPGNTTESVPYGGTDVLNITTPTLQSAGGDVPGRVSGGVGAALALGAVAVIGLAWAALRRRRAARLPARLRLERLDDGSWAYDAFVSFAHADEAVVRELVERLEGGAAPLRLCVHYRDWVPGGWIPAQIAASVRVSRRTVAVVSEAFLRSKWTRAEFREAYAAAMEDGEPRLVLVLLEDPARLQLDAELRAYVSGNTYVRWGDPWFWEKLRRALPPPLKSPMADPPAVSMFPPPCPPSPSPSPAESVA